MRSTPAAACVVAALLAAVASAQERDYFFFIKTVQHKAAKDYVEIRDLDLVMLSHECTYLDATLTIKEDLPDDTMITVSPELMVGNTWHMVAPTGPMKLCEYMEQYKYIMEMLWRASNFSRECPVTKGDVIIEQFHVLESFFPMVLIGDEWRLFMSLTIGKVEILNLKINVNKLPIEKKKTCEELEEEEKKEKEKKKKKMNNITTLNKRP